MRLVKISFRWMISLLSSIQHLPLLLFEILLGCSEIFLEYLWNLVWTFWIFSTNTSLLDKKILHIKYNKIFSNSGLSRFSINVDTLLLRFFLPCRFITFSNTLTRYFFRLIYPQWHSPAFLSDWFIHSDTVLFSILIYHSYPEACWNIFVRFINVF